MLIRHSDVKAHKVAPSQDSLLIDSLLFSIFTCSPGRAWEWEKKRVVAYAWWYEEEAMCTREWKSTVCREGENIVNIWMRRAAGHSGSRTVILHKHRKSVGEDDLQAQRARETAAGILQSSDIQIVVCFNSWYDVYIASFLLYYSISVVPEVGSGQIGPYLQLWKT